MYALAADPAPEVTGAVPIPVNFMAYVIVPAPLRFIPLVIVPPVSLSLINLVEEKTSREESKPQQDDH